MLVHPFADQGLHPLDHGAGIVRQVFPQHRLEAVAHGALEDILHRGAVDRSQGRGLARGRRGFGMLFGNIGEGIVHRLAGLVRKNAVLGCGRRRLVARGFFGLEDDVILRFGRRRHGRRGPLDKFLGQFQHIGFRRRRHHLGGGFGRRCGGGRFGRGRAFGGVFGDDLADGGENFLHGRFVLRTGHQRLPEGAKNPRIVPSRTQRPS